MNFLAGAALIPAHGGVKLGDADPNMLAMWERTQKRFGSDLPINSAYRDPNHNKNVGGAKKSQHMHGKALDIDVSNLSREERKRLIHAARAEGFTGIGVYNNALHFDTGPQRAWGPNYSRTSLPPWAKPAIEGDIRVAQAATKEEAVEPSRYFLERFDQRENADPQPSKPAEEVEGSRYFLERFDEMRREKEGPDVEKTAPAGPGEMEKMKEERGFLGSIYDGVKSAIVGDAEYDVPELQTVIGTDDPSTAFGVYDLNAPLKYTETGEKIVARMRAADPKASVGDINERMANFQRALALADNENAMAEIVRKYVPGAAIVADKNGNLYVDIDGDRFALDKSGVSARDAGEVVQLGIVGAAAHPVIRGAGWIGGTAGRLAAGAGLGAAEQFGEQAISNAVGGNQPTDAGRIILGGVFGLGGEALARVVEKVGPDLLAAITRSKSKARNRAEFLKALEAEGYTPSEANAALAQALQGTDADGMGKEALLRIAHASNLPEPVPLTAGQATRDPALMRREDMARNTPLYGEDVQAQAQELSTRQQNALGANMREMVGEFDAAGDRGGRGGALQGELTGKRAADKVLVDKVYKSARDAGDVTIGVEPIKAFTKRLRTGVAKRGSSASMPVTFDYLGRLEKIINRPGVKGVKLQLMEDWRSAVTQALANADRGDKVGLRHLLREYDAAAVRGMEGAVTKGDPNAIGLWKNAVRERAKFGRRWERDDIIRDLSITKKDRSGLTNVAPEDVMAYLLGKSNLGEKKATRRSVVQLKKFLGGDSEGFRAIQAQALVMMLGKEPGMMNPGEVVSTKLVENLRKVKSNNPDLFRALFTEKQQKAIERLATTIHTINVPPRSAGQMNNSGTGYANVEAGAEVFKKLDRAFTVFSRQFGPLGDIVAGTVRPFLTRAGDKKTAEAIQRSLGGKLPDPPRPQSLAGVGPAAGAMGSERVGQGER